MKQQITIKDAKQVVYWMSGVYRTNGDIPVDVKYLDEGKGA